VQYLFWFHYANSNLQAFFIRYMIARRFDAPADHPTLIDLQPGLERALAMTNQRLGEADYLAGKEFTAADIMIFFSLTTVRYVHILRCCALSQHPALPPRIGSEKATGARCRRVDPERAPLLS
jgi:glutathione S-transferase